MSDPADPTIFPDPLILQSNHKPVFSSRPDQDQLDLDPTVSQKIMSLKICNISDAGTVGTYLLTFLKGEF